MSNVATFEFFEKIGAVTILLHADEWIEIPERNMLLNRDHIVSLQCARARATSGDTPSVIEVGTTTGRFILPFQYQPDRDKAYNDLKLALAFCKTATSPVNPDVADAKARVGLNVSE